MAAISPALAAPPVTLQFAPLGGQATPSVLSFHIPLADGEHVSDIRFQAGDSETSLMTAFELTPASGGVSARFLPALDFSPYAGQSFTLKVLKAGSATGAGEEQLLLKIIPPGDLQRELKLAAVGDGTAQADVLEFTLPGAVNVTLSDLLLVSSSQSASIRDAFALNRNRSGDIQANLRTLNLDAIAGQSFEMRAVKTLDGSAAPLTRKLILTPLTVGEFTRDVTLPVPVSGDAQPDPFTLALAAEANVEVTDITLGAASILSLFNLTRASNGALSAQLATPLDFDPLIGQSITLGVRKSVAGASYQQRIILAVALPAPRLLSRDDGNIAVNGGPAASSTLRNPQYVLYSDAAGTAEVARSATGRFADLIADTGYYAAIVAEALDPATSTWAAQKSPLLAVSTQQANPDAFAFSPASGVSRSAEVTANSITVSGIRGRARISVAGGQYSIDNGVWTSAAGTVSSGQSVRVRATASGGYSTSSTVTLTIGARSGNFVVTTMAEPVVDYTPPANAPTTLDAPTLESKTTTTINMAPGTFTDGDGTRNTMVEIWNAARDNKLAEAANGDFSGLSPETTYSLKTVGEALNGTSGAWESKSSAWIDVATEAPAPDTTPNAFDFTNMTNQALSAAVTTNAITVVDINTPVTASTTVGTLVKNGVDTGLSTVTVNVGDTLAVKLTTSASYATTVNGTVTIGTGATSTDNFSVVTMNIEVPPVMGDVPNQNGVAGALFNLALSGYVTLTNGDAIIGYTATDTLPSQLYFDSTTGVFSGRPDQVGTFNVTVTASDDDGASNSDSFQIVIAPHPAPTGVALNGTTLTWNLVDGGDIYLVCWDGGATCHETQLTNFALLPGHDGKVITVQSSMNGGATWSAVSSSVTADLSVNASASTALTGVNEGDSVNQTITIANESVKIATGDTQGGITIAPTGAYSADLTVSGAASTAGSFTFNLVIQDSAGNQTNKQITLVVSSPI